MNYRDRKAKKELKNKNKELNKLSKKELIIRINKLLYLNDLLRGSNELIRIKWSVLTESLVKNTNKTIKPIKTYLIKEEGTSFYKIGMSNNPNRREKTLQRERPNISVIKIWDKNIEKRLHSDYKDYRVRGEWFDLTKIQVKYICASY
jgi:hypothetical protein